VGSAHVRAAGSDDSIGGVAPSACIGVRSAEELRELFASPLFSRRPKPAVVVRGGATMIEVGNPPGRLDLVLETGPMSEIREYRPEDMTVTVQAGLSLNGLNRILAEHDQRVVLDSRDPARASIGGLLACDRPGSFGYGYGAARDRVLGLEVVDGRGRKLRFGGRVVKNVAGYDVGKLFVGSYGTLGIITEATLRTHPRPQRSETVTFLFHSIGSAKRFRSALLACSMQPVSFDLGLTADGETPNNCNGDSP